MKRLLLFSTWMIFVGFTFSQTIYTNCLDGQIWFKLKDDVVLNKHLQYKNQQSLSEAELVRAELPFLQEFFKQYGVEMISKPFAQFKAPAMKRTYQLEFSDFAKVDEMIRFLSQIAEVEYAERVPLMQKTLVPNDPLYSQGQQWGLFRIQAETAWNYSTGSSSIVVAVVDDAVDITHPDLSSVLWTNTGEIPGNGIDDDGNGYVDDVNGVNVATTNPALQGSPMPGTPLADFDHGTHVAGIACAATNNGVGIASIGHGVRLMGIRAASNNASLTSTLQGVLYAIDNGANVVNMSYGSASFSNTYQNAITYGYNQNVVMVAACGNDNVSSVFYPAGYDHVISVAASNGNDAKASFSNYDNGTEWIDLAAPGTSIYSTLPVGMASLYGNKQGTSMASPLVAGLCGLMLSLNGSLSPDDIEDCLKTTCDPITGSFSAQLGSGRINASAAMACVSSTLSWAPQADFMANLTVIPQGASVNFTDLSIYNPTTRSWTFTGGTPGTSTAVNPQNIVYNTPGTYPVSLQVTNANGTDTETKLAYIQVNASTGCDTIRHTLPNDTVYTYTFSANNYLGGTNSQGAIGFSEYYQASEFPPGSSIQSMMVYFVRGATTDPNATVQINIWSGVGATPGALLHTQLVSLQEIEDNQTVPGQPNSFYPTIIEFDNPYLITGNFFIGVTVPNPVPSGQEFAIAYTHDFNNDMTGRPNYSWLRLAATNAFSAPAGWYAFDNFFVGNPRQAMHMQLYTTQFPVQANIQLSAASICAGDEISFQNSTNTNVVTNEWFINGVNNGYVSANNPSFIHNTPGNYMNYLIASNSCGFYAIDSAEVTINANPIISVSPQNEYICPGGNVALTASGATSYTWSPAGTLSASTGANVTATPTGNTTYSITGTASGCSSTTEVTVYVEEMPVVEIAATPLTGICYNQPVYFDGQVNSDYVTQFSWTFSGGTPTTSVTSTEFVTFPSAGSYDVTLVGSNGCGDSDTENMTIVVGDCDFLSIEEYTSPSINGYFNESTQELLVSFEQMEKGSYELTLFSMLGQKIQTNKLNVDMNTQHFKLTTNDMAEGIYLAKVNRGEFVYTFKFKK